MFFSVIRLDANLYLWAVFDRWPPSYSGLAESQAEVDHMARQHGIAAVDYRPQFNQTLWDYARSQYPVFSFIKRQPGIFFACVWENNLQFLCNEEPIIQRDHIGREEVVAMGGQYGSSHIVGDSWNGAFIRLYIRRREAQRKLSIPKLTRDFVFVDFLYSPESEWMLPRKRWTWQRHRIVKKTAQTVFVEEKYYQGNSYLKTGWQAFIVYLTMIDRARLERDHFYHHHSRHKTFFEKAAVPDLLIMLCWKYPPMASNGLWTCSIFRTARSIEKPSKPLSTVYRSKNTPIKAATQNDGLPLDAPMITC